MYRSITRKYFNTTDGLIVVFDISYKDSFNQTRYWIDSFKEYSKSSQIILVGNKCDLTHSVDKKIAEVLTEGYFETSSKEDKGIDEFFAFLAKEIYYHPSSEVKETKPKEASTSKWFHFFFKISK